MKKDVIYIDIDDDITTVIDKLKNSAEKIVALVPPKGNAVLQSVVNLKLLKRAATKSNKQAVIVTSNHALTALAGGLDLYVAKNLQSKPVLASTVVDELADDEEVEVSDNVNDLTDAGSTVSLAPDDSTDNNEVEISGEELAALDADTVPAVEAQSKKKDSKKGKSSKVPNFDGFRKKLLIGAGVLFLVLILLISVFGRSKATVVIRAETTPVDVAFTANFNANSTQSDFTTYNLKATVQESKKTISQSFTATGQKDVGTKATGTMKISNCQTPTSFAVPQNTNFTSNGLTFTSTTAVTVPGAQGNFISGCTKAGTANVDVVATANGDNYNLSAREYSNSLGEKITSTGGQMSGGVSKVVKVVSQDDVDKAKEQLSQQDTNQTKEELKKAFGPDTTVLDDTFLVTMGTAVSEPAVNQEANDGKVTVEARYTLLGAANSEMGGALDAAVISKMTDKDQQRVYDNGFSNMKLEKVSSTDKTAVYNVSSSAQYGPQFNTQQLKTQIAGKKFGEARSYLQDLPGVKGVDIKLSPFWARKLPGASKIDIKLDVDKNNGG